MLISKLIKANLDGDLSNDALRAICTACNVILSTLEVGELQDRIKILEELANEH